MTQGSTEQDCERVLLKALIEQLPRLSPRIVVKRTPIRIAAYLRREIDSGL